MKTTIACIPGFLWCIIPSIIGWIILGIIRIFEGRRKLFTDIWINKYLCVTFEINKCSKFFDKAMEGWFGFCIGCNRIVVDIDTPTRKAGNLVLMPKDHPDYQQMRHELKHVFQNYAWGIFFYPAYILIALYLRFCTEDKHAHANHPLERQARAFAGQQVIIPREQWEKKYGSDRWPWWK